jgi:hypothetical protein
MRVSHKGSEWGGASGPQPASGFLLAKKFLGSMGGISTMGKHQASRGSSGGE